jgi:hypothetical protein
MIIEVLSAVFTRLVLLLKYSHEERWVLDLEKIKQLNELISLLGAFTTTLCHTSRLPARAFMASALVA